MHRGMQPENVGFMCFCRVAKVATVPKVARIAAKSQFVSQFVSSNSRCWDKMLKVIEGK